MASISVKFSAIVVFTEGVTPNGVVIIHNNGGFFTISSVTGSGSDLVYYVGTWNIDPVSGDEVTWLYTDSAGDYRSADDDQLGDQSLNIINCLDVEFVFNLVDSGNGDNLIDSNGVDNLIGS